jgi:hypothetical protein
MATPKTDPYERDSDHEYAALEADRARERTVRRDAERFDTLDMEHTLAGDDDVELAAPSASETRRGLEALGRALDGSVDRDPEALAIEHARRAALDRDLDEGSGPEDELQARLDRMMDRTPLSADDLDTEAIMDPAPSQVDA